MDSSRSSSRSLAPKFAEREARGRFFIVVGGDVTAPGSVIESAAAFTDCGKTAGARGIVPASPGTWPSEGRRAHEQCENGSDALDQGRVAA